MVRPADQDDKRLRPQIYFAIWQSTHRKTRHPAKLIHGIPSPNRRPIQTKEPVDQTILMTGNLERPQGMDTLAHTRNNGTQQSDQYDHQTIPQPNSLWV